MINFGHAAKIEDGHVTYAHETTNPARANYKATKPPLVAKYDYHIPGYGGFVPGVQSKNSEASDDRTLTWRRLVCSCRCVLIACLSCRQCSRRRSISRRGRRYSSTMGVWGHQRRASR